MVQKMSTFFNVHTIENVLTGGQKSQNLVNKVCERPLSTNNLSRGLKIPTDKLDYHILIFLKPVLK